jgi:peptidoglycan/LPS O-acetylase OafA/YrhL
MSESRLDVLDGWRGISISLVLAGHLFPIGPKIYSMNESVAATGMVVFFILSGFLITNLLMRDAHVGNFLIRRFLRIVPLAWLVMAFTFLCTGDDFTVWWRNFSFSANMEPFALVPAGSHFWSLCVEVQFYLGVAVLVAVAKKRSLWLLPIFALAVTGHRVYNGVEIAVNTLYRVDEILAGCTLALLYQRQLGGAQSPRLFSVHPLVLAPLVIFAAHPAGGWLNYLRPYLAMWMIGSTVLVARDDWFTKILKGRVLRYLATVSYALYVVHGGLRETWLASGETLVKYAKRPLFLLVTFALAHVSTHYYERYFMSLGKRLTQRHRSVPAA